MDFKINLWDYQQEAIDNMYGENGIYKNGGRIAEVILPTGAGKSFVAMQSVINVMNFKELEEIQKNKIISDTAIGYMAPNNLILYQFRLHMARFIMETVYEEIHMPKGFDVDISEVDIYVQKILSEFNIKDEDIVKLTDEEAIELNPRDRVMKTVDKNIQLLSSPKLKSVIEKAFPKFDFRCYQSTVSQKDEQQDVPYEAETMIAERETIKKVNKESQKLTGHVPTDRVVEGKKAFKNMDVEFLITDEAQRGAAPDWEKALLAFLRKNKETKVLGITATPVRSSDEEDLLRTLAKEEGQEDYIAQEIYLLEAMEKGMVVTPKVKFFPCMLDETKEYIAVMNKYIKACKEQFEKPSSNKKEVYRIILTEMHKAMGMDENISKKLLTFSRDEILALDEIKSVEELKNRQEWDEIKKAKVEEILYSEEIENPYKGKSIVFVPSGNAVESTKTVIEKFKEKFRKIFSKDKISLLEAYHSINTKSKNDDVLKQFNELGDNEDSGIVALITNKMADEGFHPDNIRNLMFMDGISAEEGDKKKKATKEKTPKTAFFQKIGRGIFGILGKPKSSYKIPVIFDFANNFGRHRETLIDFENGKNLFEIPRNIQYFFDMAELGAKELKDFQRFSMMDKDGNPKRTGLKVFGKKKDDITTIDYIDCSETENTDVLGFSGEPQKKVKKYDPEKEKDKFELLLKVLEELKKLNIDYTQISDQTKIDKEFFSKQENISEQQIKEFYASLEDLNYIGMQNYEYFIGEALANFREAFWRNEQVSKRFTRVFDDYTDYKKLVELGIIVVDLDNIPENLRGKVGADGFIKVNPDMPEHAIGINVKTGTLFDENGKDEFGCREDGLDDEGYDKTGFNERAFNKKTKCKYDKRYFYLDEKGKWKNKFTGTELDIFGYNHEGINPQTGFDRGNFEQVGNSIPNLVHLWHRKTEDGYSRIGKVYSETEDGKKIQDFHGFESGKEARLRSTGSKVMPSGFFRDRTTGDKSYFKYDSITDKELNIDRVDYNGFYFPTSYNKGDKVYNILTSSPYGLDGKDVTGKFPKEFQIGLEVCKKLLQGQDIESITKEFSDKNIDLDSTIAEAYEHLLIHKDFIMLDDEVEFLYNQISNNEIIINKLGTISNSFKTQMWNIAENEKLELRRALSFSKIECRTGGEPVKIVKTVDNTIKDDAEAR